MTPSGAPTMARGRPRPPPKWTRVSIPGIFLEFSRDSRDSESEQRNSVVRHIRLTPTGSAQSFKAGCGMKGSLPHCTPRRVLRQSLPRLAGQ